MSGKRIDDHSDWIGGKEKGMPLPMHTKTKSYSSAEGAGHVGTSYPDTDEAIKRDQDMGISSAKRHPMKSGYRN